MPGSAAHWKERWVNFVQTNRRWALWVTGLALLARFALFFYPSGDYVQFLRPWFEELKSAGGLAAIGKPVGDYMVTYVYILAFLTHLPLPPILSIKLVSCLGDVLLAFYGGRLARSLGAGAAAGRTVYTALLFLPTVLLNSGAWGQCDSLYTAALLAFVDYSLQQRPGRAMLAYGIAFAFKLQAVFLAPMVLYLWLAGRVRFRHLLAVPGVYLVAVLPAFFAGRPLRDLLTIYLRQTGTYTALSLGAPNLYAWLPEGDMPLLAALGIALAAAASAATAARLAVKIGAPTRFFLLRLAFFYLVMVPYLLPRMHERYFYPADVLAVICFFTAAKRRERLACAAMELCSFLVVCRFLFGWQWVSPALLSLAVLWVLVEAWRQIAPEKRR